MRDVSKAENGRVERQEEPEFLIFFFFWATELITLEPSDF